MALAEDAPLSVPSWRLATPALRRLKLSGACWDVWNAMCDLQAGRNRYVFAGALALAEATGKTERTAYRARQRLEDSGLIRKVITGGGRRPEPEKGSPGNASVFALGPVAEAALERRKGVKIVTLLPDRRVTKTTPFKGDESDTPPSSSYGLSALRPTPDDERDGSDPGPIRPDDQRGEGELTPLKTVLQGLDLKRSPDPPGEPDDVTISSLLATPIDTAPALDLPPPRRRRR